MGLSHEYDLGGERRLQGVPVLVTPGGKMSAGPVYAPTYMVEGTRDKVLIDDKAFTASDGDRAAILAVRQRVDTQLAGLIWTGKVAVVPLSGIRCRKGQVGPMRVLFIEGPAFDTGRREDDRVIAQRKAAGLPTGEPGDRKIIVTSKKDL